MNVLFRADASQDIGIGHVMRCLALAQTLQREKHHITFLMLDSAPALEMRLIKENINIQHLFVEAGSCEDVEQVIKVAHQLDIDWVVADGYQFETNYQHNLKQAGLKVLLFDDYGHGRHYYVDLVLNQNLNADENVYLHREDYTELLLGCSFSLLRQEFLVWRGWQRKIPNIARKILVTLGGADFENVTLKVLNALRLIRVEGLQILVVVGSRNPHYKGLQIMAQQMSHSVDLVSNAENMPDLMAWADLAIAAGGSTNWELAFMGLPTIVIVLANNQQKVAQELAQSDVILNLGWHQNQTKHSICKAILPLLSDLNQRQLMSQAARKIIDGRGAQRVVNKMKHLHLKKQYQ